MIGIRNQDGLFDQIERELLHESYPASCNLVVPPGFGEHSLVKAIGKRLCDREPTSGALVAVVEPDSLKDVRDYVATLHVQWSRHYRLPSLQQAPSDHWALDALMSWLPRNRPVIQVVSRFHKLVNCLGTWVLGRLRSFSNKVERFGHLR